MNDKAQYWLDIAEYDLETARAMLKTGRYLYVGFMCHQVIEKLLKAAIARFGQRPPYIHNLSTLAQLAKLYEQLSDGQKDVLDTLEPLNIQARYPDDKKRLSGMLTADASRRILEDTEELYKWIRATL